LAPKTLLLSGLRPVQEVSLSAKRKQSKQKTRANPAQKAPSRSPGPKNGPAPKSSSGAKSGSGARGNDRLGQLQQLIELMAAQDVVEVELEEAGTRWRVRRKEEHPTVTYAASAPMPMAGHQFTGAAPASPALAASTEPQGEVFKSPMLGTFYRAPSPEAESFVKAGDRVGPDSTLCIIEAMKVMNEIKAEREFQVLEVLVRNGDPVEYGQPMFLIRS